MASRLLSRFHWHRPQRQEAHSLLHGGAPEEVYINDNGNAFDKLMFAQMFAAGFTGMEFAGMIYTCSVSYAMRNEAGQAEVFKAKADDHAQRLTALIANL